MSLPLSPPVFSILRGIIRDRMGLHFDDPSLLAEKASRRALELGFESLLDYYYFLRYDPAGPAELDALAEHLVVNETYLFREVDQLKLAVRLIAARAARGCQTRVWSAACSTGEEPVTLALLLAAESLLGGVQILATDISGRVLETARAGVYGRRSLRRTFEPGTQGFLHELPGGAVQVDRAILDAIAWQKANLVDAAAIATLGKFDIVFCRNVMIYFDDDTARAVIASLTDRLDVGGALFVGVSESLMRFGTFLACEEQGGVFFYRKAAT